MTEKGMFGQFVLVGNLLISPLKGCRHHASQPFLRSHRASIAPANSLLFTFHLYFND